ncbi:iron-containing redox enzyme family protein [Micromonospora sp. DT231]|uniref:iron-containing redox enzyme family protein n=1 Tax=Micromonospora sp. DT231 TaxID=3416526 RepID=UPI003CF62C92
MSIDSLNTPQIEAPFGEATVREPMAFSAVPSQRDAPGEFAEQRPYRPTAEPFIPGNPYRRPLDRTRLASIDWTRAVTESRFVSDESLMAHRFLMNVYESDALFLPEAGMTAPIAADYESFYSRRSRLLGEIARPLVEDHALGFLADEVRTTGQWDVSSVEAHLTTAIDEANQAASLVVARLQTAPEPRRAAELLIAQMALDGLTEATAMSQNIGGAFGPEQSELFKIFIDEFGYGVFGAKHSTLFVEMCRSVGMATDSHHYWFFYLPSSIAVNNYFYLVTRNRTGFFRYVGAMAYLEATFATWFRQLSSALRGIYGEAVDTRYCDEHAHIDQHHGRMAVHDLVLPLVAKHGTVAAREVIRGVEEIRLLGALGDADLLAQLDWEPQLDQNCEPMGPIQHLAAGDPFDTRVADATTVCAVRSGHLQLHWRPTGEPLRIEAGCGVRIPAGRLYGLRCESEATYTLSGTR